MNSRDSIMIFKLHCLSLLLFVIYHSWSNPLPSSNVKSTIFQDRKLPFCCFRSKKDRMETFLNQNSGSKQKRFLSVLNIFWPKAFVLSVSKNFLNYLNVLFCLWKNLAQFVRFWFRFDIIFENTKVLFWFLSSLKQKKTFQTSKKIWK